jgi:hypothetical protein
MSVSRVEIGCCGAYCKTCRALADGACRGCKLGYDTGERDLSRARCRMKLCCLTRMGTPHTCADCDEFDSCVILQSFFAKKGYKYGRYREALEYIRRHGYEAFLANADGWRGPYGRLSPPQE